MMMYIILCNNLRIFENGQKKQVSCRENVHTHKNTILYIIVYTVHAHAFGTIYGEGFEGQAVCTSRAEVYTRTHTLDEYSRSLFSGT